MNIIGVSYSIFITNLTKIILADNVFLAGLSNLDDDRDDEQDDNQATGYSNDSEVCVIQGVQDTGLPLLC